MRKLIGVALLCGAGAVSAGVPELEEGVQIWSGTGPLTVKPYTAPSVIDWNSDGRKDLLVGQFDWGNIWLFLNKGTDARPALGATQALRVGGDPITTSYG
jgi:hypothetical protein